MWIDYSSPTVFVCIICPLFLHSFTYTTGDPWREATVSADGLHKANTTTQPIYEGDGFHCSDLITKNGVVDETIYTVQMAGLEYMKEWLA